ncbi:MAG: PaeR7I family type II restriction endonuclease [Verrucomicrobiales bacterium]|nr:PaeR7I family type II restriction endonuclease [Verrucomicrobiales bacterium]
MNIEIGDYPKNAKKAVRFFWRKKREAQKKKQEKGTSDQGQRGGATGGKNLDGFVDLITDIIKKSSSQPLTVCTSTKEITLPGYFRSSKRWDIVVIDQNGRMLAAIELKSLGGPSYGNNANNRCEEAIGNAVDFRTAQREGAFGEGTSSFLGYLILVEDDDKSSAPPKNPTKSPHFDNDPIFEGASYQKRMAILCDRLVQEELYDAAIAIAAKDDGGKSGTFKDLSEASSLKKFLLKVAAHIATETEVDDSRENST